MYVTRRLLRLLVLVAALLAMTALALTGCGEGEREKYADEYKPLNARLLRIGAALGAPSLDERPERNAKLATELGRHASDLKGVNADIAALDTPAGLDGDARLLTGTIDAVVTDLEKFSAAVRRGDQKAAAAGASALARDSNRVNGAQNKLARATGADIGPR